MEEHQPSDLIWEERVLMLVNEITVLIISYRFEVCRFAGTFEHVMQSTTAGVIIQIPQVFIFIMMRIDIFVSISFYFWSAQNVF